MKLQTATSYQNSGAAKGWSFFEELPQIAILRQITSDQIVPVVDTLIEAGFRVIEVPLTSPGALNSIERIAAKFGDSALIGAGTVMHADDVHDTHSAGGQLIVSPHVDKQVLERARQNNMVSFPGVMTPTEGFQAVAYGASGLKVFPAEAMSPAVIRAWRSAFSPAIPLLPTGGINPDGLHPWMEAGASGFGIGGALFAPNKSMDAIRNEAIRFCSAWKVLRTTPV